MKSSNGVSPYFDLKVQNPPVCAATGDQNHRSVPLWKQPTVRWGTGLLFHNLEIVTVHRRSNSKRAYRSQAFFKKLSKIATIKLIKNKSRSY
jgi:hypothetical protein